MAIVTVSTNIVNTAIFTDALTLVTGDTVNLLPNVGIYNYGAAVSRGIQAGGSNSFILDGDVFSTSWHRHLRRSRQQRHQHRRGKHGARPAA